MFRTKRRSGDSPGRRFVLCDCAPFSRKAESRRSRVARGRAMAVAGKLEITLKISQFPDPVATVQSGWKEFSVRCGEREVQITLRPKMFAKLEEAKAKYPEWVAAISGQMGPTTPKGFALLEPNVQVFERKPKEPKPE